MSNAISVGPLPSLCLGIFYGICQIFRLLRFAYCPYARQYDYKAEKPEIP